MTKPTLTFLTFITLLMIQLNAYGQASNVLKKQRIDFERFKAGFTKLEARPDLHVSQDVIDEAMNDLEKKLKEPLSPLEQFKAYAAVMSTVQCGHTSVFPNLPVIREWGMMRQCLPFDVVMVNKKLFIAPTHEKDLEIIAKRQKADPGFKTQKKASPLKGGVEIYAIDNKSIAEWMKLISPYISSDENSEEFKYFTAGKIFDFYRYLALPTHKDSVEIRYVTRRDTIAQYVRLGLPLGNTLEERLNPEKPKKKDEFGTFSIEKSKYGYFRFKSFEKSHGNDYEKFLKKSFTEIQKKKIGYLIFDLRGNTGGMIQVELLRYLIPKGTELGTYETVKKESWWSLYKTGIKMGNEMTKLYRKNLRTNKRMERKYPEMAGKLIVPPNYIDLYFKGKIAVITDEGTFSAASVLACHLKTLRQAKIVGQTAGGTFYAGNAGTLPLKLKKSGLVVLLNPNVFHSQLDGTHPDSLVKVPDLVVFSEAQVPEEKYPKRKEKSTKDDPVIKAAEKILK